SPTVNSDKVVGASMTVFMDVSSQCILARAGFTIQQNTGRNIQYRINSCHYLTHAWRTPKNSWARPGKLAKLRFQTTIFQSKMPLLQRMAQQLNQFFMIKR